MWEGIITLALWLVKWIFEKSAQKKLSTEELVEHILHHQRNRNRTGQASIEATEARERLLATLRSEDNS